MGKLSLINKQFIKAIQNNQIDKVKNLLDQGADIHDDNDWALRESAFYGYLEIVKFLLTQGANIHADDDYALREAATNGHLETVKYLLTQGSNIHAKDDEALRYSAISDHLETVKCLVTNGANVHTNNDEPLRWAAEKGHLEIVKFLITQGANIHANNDEALKESVRNEHDDVWQLLSALIQEEKLLVAALGVTSATEPTAVPQTQVLTLGSTGMPLVTALGSGALVATSDPIRVALPLGVAQTQRLSTIKPQRSKV